MGSRPSVRGSALWLSVALWARSHLSHALPRARRNARRKTSARKPLEAEMAPNSASTAYDAIPVDKELDGAPPLRPPARLAAARTSTQ